MKSDLDLYDAIDTLPFAGLAKNNLYTQVSTFLDFINSSDCFTPSILERTKQAIDKLFQVISSNVRSRGRAIFITKNSRRGGLWKDARPIGAAIEIHGKLSRLHESPKDLDSLIDLFNYLKIFLMCISINRIRVKSSSSNKKQAMITGQQKGGLGEILAKIFHINGYKVPYIGPTRTDTEAYTAIRKFNHLSSDSILINNYGINHLNWIGNLDRRDFAVIDINLKIPLLVVNEVIRKGWRPRIINICSQTYKVAQRCTSAYCSAKAGLAHLTKVMARELAPKGIVVNAIAPGLIEDTTMNKLTTQQVLELRGWPEDQASNYAKSLIPMHRYTTREEVAIAVYKIAHLPDYINGAIIDMTGGQ